MPKKKKPPPPPPAKKAPAEEEDNPNLEAPEDPPPLSEKKGKGTRSASKSKVKETKKTASSDRPPKKGGCCCCRRRRKPEPVIEEPLPPEPLDFAIAVDADTSQPPLEPLDPGVAADLRARQEKVFTKMKDMFDNLDIDERGTVNRSMFASLLQEDASLLAPIEAASLSKAYCHIDRISWDEFRRSILHAVDLAVEEAPMEEPPVEELVTEPTRRGCCC